MKSHDEITRCQVHVNLSKACQVHVIEYPMLCSSDHVQVNVPIPFPIKRPQNGCQTSLKESDNKPSLANVSTIRTLMESQASAVCHGTWSSIRDSRCCQMMRSMFLLNHVLTMRQIKLLPHGWGSLDSILETMLPWSLANSNRPNYQKQYAMAKLSSGALHCN